MSFKDKIVNEKLPQHIAIIMDGNGRWAKKNGKERYEGHYQGVETVHKIVEASAELGVKFLTLYAFSTENWHRPKEEVDALMHLFVETIEQELPTLNKNGIRLRAIGDIASMPQQNIDNLNETMAKTEHNNKMDLVLALSYSGRWEIMDAVKKILKDQQTNPISAGEITEELFSSYLNTAGIPDPELLIRTSGELRISNYLLWQIAYTELYITPKLWPEFDKEDLYEAIVDFQNRERRFGMTSDQIKR
ncbi:MAG: isoprenyl transferase [Bacteroidetes bacterium]|nr:MAG: isoprenyl transferase [Bacteroidota bacterium]